MSIDVHAVSHRYKKTIALDNVTLNVPAGASVAIVGPDGVGKSTLLGLIAGVRRVQSGHVRALGGDMTSAAHRNGIAGRIAYMPQGLGRNLYPTLSVVENIDFFARLYGIPKAARRSRIEHLLEATGLAPFPDRPAGKLSGGMKQKLGLCCSLVHDPDLLILDEPTTGVDPLSRRQFWELIAGMRAQRSDLTLIVATAYMDEAERFERVVAIDEGRILASGLKAEVLAQADALTVEDAYLALQRPSRRGDRSPLIIPKLEGVGGPPAIDARELTIRYGDFTAVDHVSFQIAKGEIFGFLGPNGCGKSTTMKMLTGLLPASSGSAALLGQPVNAQDLQTRMRVGYVSQAFSLYEEISVRANLQLHGRLYQIKSEELPQRVNEALTRFDLDEAADALPSALPIGMRQRLQLAAACLHKPDVLILDEPTSGVDPAARDRFWRLLVEMSRRDGVTIFISTHFMNEAERCDRVSLMNAGRVLAMGAPEELQRARAADSLEAAFISYLEDQDAANDPSKHTRRTRVEAIPHQSAITRSTHQSSGDSLLTPLRRTLVFAQREALELARDPLRVAFALLAPMFLLVIMGLGISFDIEKVRFAVLDRDQSMESRNLLDSFARSRYFEPRVPLSDAREMDQRLLTGELRFALEIPPSFGRDLLQGRRPELSVWLEGGATFPAEIARAYILGALQAYEAERRGPHGAERLAAISVEPRFRYNQAFRSVFAIAPGAIMLLLILMPAMLTAVGIVREKELGSITNVYASPAGVGEFLVGKQLPYFALGMISYGLLLSEAIFLFGMVPKGSLIALTAGAGLYVFAATAFGLLVSAFVTTQVAAIFAAAISTAMTAAHYSGFLLPASTLEGMARVMGMSFPSLWFQTISLGVFAKGLGPLDFVKEYAVLLGFGLLFLALARMAVRKQGA